MEGTIPKGRVVTLASFGIIAGIGVFSFKQLLPTEWCLVLAVASAVLTFSFRRKSKLALVCILLAGSALGTWRYSVGKVVLTPHHISFYNQEKVEFIGIVDKEPVEKPQGWQLTIKVERGIEPALPLTGLVLVSVPTWPQYSYGERLRISCRLEKPENHDFAYNRYLARFNIYSLCNRPQIKILERDKGEPWRAWIVNFKQHAYRLAQTNLPEPTAGLALPVVFGNGQLIDEDINNDFRRTGLTHIMAVSGFNVSLLTVLVGLLLRSVGLRRRTTFLLTTVIIFVYVVMVGAPASAVRAGVMSLLLLLALTVGRLADLPRTILLVAVMTLLVNPRLLRDDIGWQLSFLALLGLIYLHPWLQKMATKLSHGKGKWIIEGLMATIAAQVATAPVIIYNFGQFSVIAPIANLLVVWVIPLLTITMMISLALTAIFPALGLIFFFPCWLMVKYIFWIVQTLSAVPGASWEIN